jgi:CubicO group peptidase (beta-lactamase class C family)
MKSIFALLLTLSFSTTNRAQIAADSLTIELTELSDKSDLIGFAVAIVDKDSIVYAQGFGYADKASQSTYTINTVQTVASISKTLLAVALMKAQELGKLNLDDNINDHLPFKIINPNFPNDKITIRHLANHTSSILDGDSYERRFLLFMRNYLSKPRKKYRNG